MIPLRLSEVAPVLECAMPDRDVAFDRVVTDSRLVRHGALFAALPGSQVDGHDFARAARDLGARALLVNRPLEIDLPQLVVDDVLVALGRLAGYLRRRLDPSVVGITGSNGKTTVKEMLTAILGRQGEVLATRGNYNNELGVPLSLFRLKEQHRFAVVEMGAAKLGDIAYLASIARPDVGLVNNIGPAHLQGFGSEENIARGKGEMYSALPADGCAVINADEPWVPMWRELNTAKRTLTFGRAANSDLRLVDDGGRPRIESPAGRIDLQLRLPGRHNLLNAAAAATAAFALGIETDVIASGLAAASPVAGRLNLIRTEAGWIVIDDTYNANPASLYSALQVLTEMQGTEWLVLGDMKELGENSHRMHAEVGEAARALGVRRLYAIGEMTRYAVDAFGHGARHFQDRASLVQALKSDLHSDVICLVKGSRSMGMEAVVQAISSPSDLRETD